MGVMDTLVIRPLPMSRRSHLILAIAVPVICGGIGSLFSGTVALVLQLVGVPAGIYLAVRGYRWAVFVRPDAFVVRGLLRTRTIPRAAVVEVTFTPALRWRLPSGRRRSTPLVGLMEMGGYVLPAVRAHNSKAVAQLMSIVEGVGYGRGA